MECRARVLAATVPNTMWSVTPTRGLLNTPDDARVGHELKRHRGAETPAQQESSFCSGIKRSTADVEALRRADAGVEKALKRARMLEDDEQPRTLSFLHQKTVGAEHCLFSPLLGCAEHFVFLSLPVEGRRSQCLYWLRTQCLFFARLEGAEHCAIFPSWRAQNAVFFLGKRRTVSFTSPLESAALCLSLLLGGSRTALPSGVRRAVSFHQWHHCEGRKNTFFSLVSFLPSPENGGRTVSAHTKLFSCPLGRRARPWRSGGPLFFSLLLEGRQNFVLFSLPGGAAELCSFLSVRRAKNCGLSLSRGGEECVFSLSLSEGGEEASSSSKGASKGANSFILFCSGRANSSFLLLLEGRKKFFWRADFLPAGGRSCLFLP